MSRREISAWLLLVCFSGGAFGLATDASQPISIEADTVDIDEPSGTAVYEGHVHLTQGSIQLTADRVVVYSKDRRHVDRVVAIGLPAQFQQRLDRTGEELRAAAETIEYLAEEALILLEGNARLVQGINEFAGQRIEYSTKEEVVRATGAAAGTDRVRVIIHPETPPAPEPGPVPEQTPVEGQ